MRHLGILLVEVLQSYGDDGEHKVLYLGSSPQDGEILFSLQSKSKTDKGMVWMGVSEFGGLIGCRNNMGKGVVAELVMMVVVFWIRETSMGIRNRGKI
ncbi:MAG: hypothetical protein VCF25_21845 [Candidatus Poribacteria bacterium]